MDTSPPISDFTGFEASQEYLTGLDKTFAPFSDTDAQTGDMAGSVSLTDQDAEMSGVDKRRNKLGYTRTSLACMHCRKRKIRCIPSPTQGVKCEACLRLKKDCKFVTVDEAADYKGRSASASRSSVGSGHPAGSPSPSSSAYYGPSGHPMMGIAPIPLAGTPPSMRHANSAGFAADPRSRSNRASAANSPAQPDLKQFADMTRTPQVPAYQTQQGSLGIANWATPENLGGSHSYPGLGAQAYRASNSASPYVAPNYYDAPAIPAAPMQPGSPHGDMAWNMYQPSPRGYSFPGQGLPGMASHYASPPSGPREDSNARRRGSVQMHAQGYSTQALNGGTPSQPVRSPMSEHDIAFADMSAQAAVTRPMDISSQWYTGPEPQATLQPRGEARPSDRR